MSLKFASSAQLPISLALILVTRCGWRSSGASMRVVLAPNYKLGLKPWKQHYLYIPSSAKVGDFDKVSLCFKQRISPKGIYLCLIFNFKVNSKKIIWLRHLYKVMSKPDNFHASIIKHSCSIIVITCTVNLRIGSRLPSYMLLYFVMHSTPAVVGVF